VPGLAPAAVQLDQAGMSANAKKKAKAEVAKLMAEAKANVPVKEGAVTVVAKEEPKAEVNDGSISTTVKVPEKMIGRVVGPKGATIEQIKAATGIKAFDMQGEMCTIIGQPDEVAKAAEAVKQLVEKGFMTLSYEDFAEDGIAVHPTSFPDIIGKGGAVIQAIKKETGCEVNMPTIPKNATPDPRTLPKKYQVSLAGEKAAVEKAKEIIQSIVTYGHHEVTHEGKVHQEMEIEEWRYRFLIGAKGSEMRHIQNSFKVSVNIPREHSVCRNVVVVGEPADVERATKYIEKIMEKADQPKENAREPKAEDTWGEEGEDEPWMKAYIYKRK